MIRLVLLAIFVSTLGACSFSKDDAPENNNTQSDGAPTDVLETLQKEQDKQAFEGQLTEQNVSVQFEETAEPEHYMMHIVWPEQVKRMQITINNENPVIYTSAQGMRSHSASVGSGVVQNIQLIAYDSLGGPISSLAVRKTSPLDIVIADDTSLSSDQHYNCNRFYLINNARINTNGYDLRITAKKLYVETDRNSSRGSGHTVMSSHILTRPLLRKARNPEDLLGTNIIINAEKAVGHLRVALVGADGNDGRSGQEIEAELNISRATPPELNGAPGKPGRSEQVEKPCSKDFCVPRLEMHCRSQPTDGSPGQKGLKGHDGENGQDGGGSGNLAIVVKDQSQFSVEVIQRPGRAGKGGAGAPGHAGGIGGAPGAQSAQCKAAQKGADGPSGDNGANGLDGQPGKIGTVLPGIQKISIVEKAP